MHKDFVAPEDAVIVDRIRKSGAVLLGHTNVCRMLVDYQVWGDIYPEGKNPYNTDYTPGGSTGGGAAALAAGFSPLELGGDLGGSIRVPSNFCGLYGLKPTEKTVPLHGNIPLPKNANTLLVHMTQAGPLARTLDDIEILWKVIVGPHENERDIARIEWRAPMKASLSDYRIAWLDGWADHPVSSQVSAAIKSLVVTLQRHGSRVEHRTPEGNLHEESLDLWMGIFPYIVAQGAPWFVRPLIKRDLNSRVLKGVTKHRKEFDRAFRMSANHYGEMMLRRNLMVARWEHFFADSDFLICPVAFGPAYPRTQAGTRLSYDGTDMVYADYVWPFVACFNVRTSRTADPAWAWQGRPAVGNPDRGSILERARVDRLRKTGGQAHRRICEARRLLSSRLVRPIAPTMGPAGAVSGMSPRRGENRASSSLRTSFVTSFDVLMLAVIFHWRV